MAEERLPVWRGVTRWGIPAGFLVVLFGLAAYLVSSQVWYKSLPVVLPLGLGVVMIAVGVVANYRWLGAGLLRRKTVIALNVVAMILLALAVVVLSNLIVSRHYKRFDLTQKGVFTLSEQTLDLLVKLPKKVTVTALFTDSSDERIRWLEDKVSDLLLEYDVRSPMLEFRAINLDREQDKAREFYATLKTTPDRDSIVFQCGEETRVVTWQELFTVPAAYSPNPEDNLPKFRGEQVLTTTIKAVATEKKRAIYFTIGHGEPDIASTDPDVGYSSLAQLLERENYRVEKLNLAAAKSVPEDCAVLVVAGPRSPFSEQEVGAVRDYLAENGGLLALFDPQAAQGTSKGVGELLEEYHIRVKDDVVALWRLALGGGATGVTSDVFGESYALHPVTKGVSTFATQFSYACALEVAPPEPSPEPGLPYYVAFKLVQGSAGSWGERQMDDRIKKMRYDVNDDMPGPMTYVAGAQAFEPASGPYQRPKPAEGARIVVVANSYCAANGLLARAPGDQLLVVNSVAWLDQRALPPATIPGQDLDFRLLKQWNPRIQRVVLLLCTVAMPVLAIVLGAFVWFMRRK